MKLLLILASAAIGGFAGHLTRPIMIDQFTDNGTRYDGWFAILSYALGIIFVVPFLLSIYDTLKEIVNGKTRVLASYFLSFGAFGVGTVLGHWLLPDKVNRNK